MPASAPSLSSNARPALPPLVVDALACRRGERLLFSGLGFQLSAGQVLWVRGANGRGKTSLLRILAGLSAAATGEVRWGDDSLRAAGAAFRQGLIYIAHANALKDDLTVLEALRFLAQIHGRPSGRDELGAALKTFGLLSRRDAPVRTLSQGQRRRVALARLALDLAADDAPTLWVLDEPYDALDADGIATLDQLLSAQCRRGGAVALTSHLPLSLRDPSPVELQLDTSLPARSTLQTPADARRDATSAIA